MLFKSYNQTHNTAYEYQASSETGYQIRKTSTDSWHNYVDSMLDTSDSLYICDTTVTKAYGMWLTSISLNSSYSIVNVRYNGDVAENYYSYYDFACRPAVCLKSDIKLEPSGDGYILK